MYPQTRSLLDRIMREEQTATPEFLSQRGEDVPDQQTLALVLKKKHQTALLKKMLQDAGYTDLARMSSFRRESLHDDEDTYGG